MTKHLYVLLGLVVGIVLMEIVRRPQRQRLANLEAQAARRKATNARYEREWQATVANMPFDERMDYELWEATMRTDNWIPPEEGSDEEA